MSSIYNSDRKIEQFFLGSQEITEMFLGNEFVFSKITNNLFYKLHEFVGSLTVQNTIEAPVKSAILKGNTLVNLGGAYNRIDAPTWYAVFATQQEVEQNKRYFAIINNTGDGLMRLRYKTSDRVIKAVNPMSCEKFIFTATESDYLRIKNSDTVSDCNGTFLLLKYQEGMENWNIPYFEGMQSVKQPVLTTSNEDGTKTNILTVNEDVTLRSNGDICDELNLLTGQLTQRIGEDGVVLSQEVVKTVDLSSNTVYAYNGTTHYTCSSEEGSLIPTACIEVPVETETVE